jgi:hypothetical protein
MAVLKSSALLGRCEQCRQPFDPVYGGACARCGRLLCAVHLHGPLWRRIVARFIPRQNVICAVCRARGA